MKKIPINGLNLWQFEGLSKQAPIQHFVTDRRSYAINGEFTLSFSSIPDKTIIHQNRSMLAKAMGIQTSDLFFPSQVHKTRILHITGATSRAELMDTDALITSDRGICIAVMSADCVPVLIFDKKNNAVAAVHSGWRGTVARIVEKTLLEMRRIFGTRGKDVHAGIGPSVSLESYEVGDDVIQQVRLSFGHKNELLKPTTHNKAKLDLWEANKLQLMEFGVESSRIEMSELCTVKHNHHFFSARQGDRGRFAAGIMIRR